MLKIITILTYLLMIAVNALANILPINGLQTGEVSNLYPNLFGPAPVTFAIWGLIYLLLLGFTLYQAGLFQQSMNWEKRELVRKIQILFTVSSLANTGWVFAWHYQLIPMSTILIVILLVCLILINLAIRGKKMTLAEKLLIRLPFSVYFGWITVATIANTTIMLVFWNWKGAGIAEHIWTIAVLLVGLLIGAATALRQKDLAYLLVLIWAYAGIYLKHTSPEGFAGQYGSIIDTVLVCLGVFALLAAYLAFYRRRVDRRI